MIMELVDVLSKEPICHVEESKDSDLDEKITGDNLEKSNTSSPLEVIPDITEFTNVSPKDSALNLPQVNSIVNESIVVFSEDLPNKLLLMHDIQQVIELIPWANFFNLPHLGWILPSKSNLKGKLMSCH